MSINTQFINLICENRLPHAILLESSDMTICLETSLFIAQTLLCDNIGDNGACGECIPCIKVKTNNHPDIYILEPDETSKTIKVDMIRALRNDAFLKANEASYKIYIISCADTMNDNAQNALLKVLEEPPENVFFILNCSSADALLETVLSRVEIYKLDHQLSLTAALHVTDEVKKMAEDIALALCSENELKLLIATNKLVTAKKSIPDVLDVLAVLARNACMSLYGFNPDDNNNVAQKLAASKRKSSLLSLIDKTYIAKEKIAQNVNTNLFVTWLCAQLRRI